MNPNQMTKDEKNLAVLKDLKCLNCQKIQKIPNPPLESLLFNEPKLRWDCMKARRNKTCLRNCLLYLSGRVVGFRSKRHWFAPACILIVFKRQMRGSRIIIFIEKYMIYA